jgi:nucleotide-binding universal stress UspA family protein
MYKRILLPTDGSEITAKAVDTAVKLAATLGAEVSALAVKEPFPYSAITEMQPMPPQEFFDTQDRIATRNLGLVSTACGAVGVKCNALAIEAVHPWEAILEQAKVQGADLIVMASHGRRGMSALLLGSETQKVLTHGTIPVLVVR